MLAALQAGAGYVGVLGSRNKIAARRERLAMAGVSEDRLATLHAPIGLPIGGKSPWHIGAAALAEILHVLNLSKAEDAWPRPAEANGFRIDAIVLAAGAAERFGGGKLLAPLGDGVVLDGALAAALDSPAQRVVLVVGAEADKVAQAGRKLAERRGEADRLVITPAPDYGLGLSASLKVGVRACAGADGVLIFLGDMPRLTPEAVRGVAASLSKGAPAAATTAQGRRGHPVGISRPLFAEVLALEGDAGAGGLLDALGPALALTPIDPSALDDVDTADDLRRLD